MIWKLCWVCYMITCTIVIVCVLIVVDLFQLLKPSFEEVSQAYSTCAKYLQKKVPLQSKTLQCLSAMDPVVRGHSQTGFELKKLTQMIRLSP